MSFLSGDSQGQIVSWGVISNILPIGEVIHPSASAVVGWKILRTHWRFIEMGKSSMGQVQLPPLMKPEDIKPKISYVIAWNQPLPAAEIH